MTQMGALTLRYTARPVVLKECEGTTEQGLRLSLSVDNEAGLAWLDDALAYASAHNRPKLWAYLKAVMDEVLFEMELEARL